MNDPTVFRRDCFKPNCATTLFNQRDSASSILKHVEATPPRRKRRGSTPYLPLVVLLAITLGRSIALNGFR